MDEDRDSVLNDDLSGQTWDYRGFTSEAHCGEKADLLEHEFAVISNTPGLVPFWESEWEGIPELERFWFRCPLTPGHGGPHGTYLGTRRWYSRDFWCPPGNSDTFDTDASQWYFLWGPEDADRRVLGPMAHCSGREPAAGEVKGKWVCSLWRQHHGECKHHFVESIDFDDFDFSDFDFGEYVEATADEIAKIGDERAAIEEERVQEVLADYRSGDASQWELMDAHHLSSEEVRELIARRLTADERDEIRRRRSRKVKAQRTAMQTLWTSEMARAPEHWASSVQDEQGHSQNHEPASNLGRDGFDRPPDDDACPPVPPDVVVMIERRLQGWTLAAIGAEVGLSRERVRQLIEKHGGPRAEQVGELRAAEALTAQGNLASEIRRALETRGPMTIAEVADVTGVDAGVVTKVWPQELLHLRLHAAGNHVARWSDDSILHAIREAAQYEFPLTTNAYVDLVSQGQIKGPSMPRISQRFGSWTAACEAAGVVPGQTTRPHYESRWSDDDLLQVVRRYLLDPESPNSADRFDEWKRAYAPDGPSFGTLRNRFGSWTEVKRRALAQGDIAR